MKNRRYLYFFIAPVIFISMIFFQALNSDCNAIISKETVNNLKVNILSVKYNNSMYFYGEKIEATVTLYNNQEKATTFWLGYSLRDSMGKLTDMTPRKIKLLSKEKKEIVMEFTPEDLLTGAYSSIFTLWDKSPEDNNAKRITSIYLKEIIRIYAFQDDFENFDDKFWFKRNGFIGRTKLKSSNVFLNNNQLLIKLPEKTLEGGEIQSINEVGYGSYEIKMKIPNAPSSITGFFLYKEPDFYHEIDIEIYNEPKAYIILTSYKDGKAVNEYRKYLNFDPTIDYHKYRIDFYSNKISFYIDDNYIYSWSQGFSKENMHLVLNSWYPKWLGGVRPQEDHFLNVDWIRY